MFEMVETESSEVVAKDTAQKVGREKSYFVVADREQDHCSVGTNTGWGHYQKKTDQGFVQGN